jgi:hypothetical protein
MNKSIDKIVCSICLSNEINNYGFLDCCKHEYCFDCIIEWTNVESNCPLCKSLIKTITSSKTPIKKGKKNMKISKIIKIKKKIQKVNYDQNEDQNIMDAYYNDEEESDDSDYIPGVDLDYFQGEREFDIYNDDLYSDEVININSYSRPSLENNLLNAVYGSINRPESMNRPRLSISNLVSSDDDNDYDYNDTEFCQDLPRTPPQRYMRSQSRMDNSSSNISRRERRGMSLFARSDINSSTQNNANQSSSSSSSSSNIRTRGNKQLVALTENLRQPITLTNSRRIGSSSNEAIILLSDSDDDNNNNNIIIPLSKDENVDTMKKSLSNTRKRHSIIILSDSEGDEKENLEEKNYMEINDINEINKSNSNSSQPIVFSFTNHIQTSPIPLRQRLKDKK